ncbi:MAG TPA: hypothetical protein VF042_12040 [Gemmatimonadaceae bacterium]
MRALILAASAVITAPIAAQTTSTQIDAAKHEVSFITGPFDVPPMNMAMHGMDHSSMQMGHDEAVHTFYQFTWPVDGYAKGFRVEVRDAKGKVLPTALLHHVTGVTIDRRQYIYSSSERLFGVGKETEAVVLPGNLAVPLRKGQRIGYYVAWNNSTGKELKGVSVRVIMTWAPPQVTGDLIAVLPLWLDVNNEVGGTNTFDLAPGKSSKSFEFVAPTGGRILGISGHLHDYGVAVRLEDAETNTVLVRLAATKDASGMIQSMARKFYAVNAIHLREGHRYRVVAEYDSPLRQTVSRGAMGNLVGVIAPDDLKKWPQVNPDDPDFKRDMASLGLGGQGRSGTQ